MRNPTVRLMYLNPWSLQQDLEPSGGSALLEELYHLSELWRLIELPHFTQVLCLSLPVSLCLFVSLSLPLFGAVCISFSAYFWISVSLFFHCVMSNPSGLQKLLQLSTENLGLFLVLYFFILFRELWQKVDLNNMSIFMFVMIHILLFVDYITYHKI